MTHMYDKVAELVLKYHLGEISEEEIAELNNIRLNSGLDPKLFEELLDAYRLAADLKPVHSLTQKQRIKKYAKIAAVVIPLMIGLSLLLFKDKRAKNPLHVTKTINVVTDTVHHAPAPATSDPFMWFTKDDLQDVLRLISQNPKLEVIYKKGIAPLTFTGKIASSTCYVKFAQMLLKVNGYKSTFKGNKLTVYS